MKKILFLLTIFGLFALSSSAQTPSFSGEWTLDKSKSKLDKQQTAVIERQTLKVEQTEKEVKVTTKTKQVEMQNTVDVGGTTNTYPLDGKEFNGENDTQIGRVFIKSKGEIKDTKLNLHTTRRFETANGEVSLTTKESWVLSEDGKTLTIKRESNSPRGIINSELVFSKKS
jgi:hypothetical protein